MRQTLLFFVAMIFLMGEYTFAQGKKFDSTVKVGRIGYHVATNNKNPDLNDVAIKLSGFEKEARGMDFYTRGRVTGISIDDLNTDGFYDLVIFVYGGLSGEFGSVYVLMSQENKSLIPVILPDPMLDGKINQGYKGYDEFTMLDGTILRKFPLYKSGDEKGKPTGGSRVVQYQIVRDDEKVYKFQMLRTYEVK